MKNLKKLLSMCLALMMVLTCVPAAFAAEVDDCTIDEDAKASLTIWKFDWTNAYKDGVWNEDSFISTGWRESYVEEVLGETVREGDVNGNPDHPLGNGQNSNGYALKGVEFTILRVADIVTFTESANDQHPDYNLTQVLYAFDKDAAADLLTAIGLPDGQGRYENADVLNYETTAPLAPVDAEAGVDAQAIAQVRNCWYYQSDVLNKALKDVKIEIFSDEDCTDKVATWLQDDGKFTVTYSSDDRHMTIDITEAGLEEINGNAANVNGELFASYSNYTMRITYTATINSDASFIYGEEGNSNEVVLTWRRTSSEYYDTLIDDCHIFSFGVDLTKLFSDLDSESATEMDMFKHVKFRIRNVSDGYWLTATRDEATGIYYVTGHVTEEADGTVFYPVTVGDEFGKVVIKGVEDDSYEIYEVETANGYTLLKDEIKVDIFVEENYDRICDIYTTDVLGVLQNDPHYCFGNAAPMSILDADGGANLHLTGIPQDYLEHYFLTAYAQVDGNDVNMEDDGESANALAPLTIVNTQGFDLPQTGDHGTWMYGVIGITLMAGALVVMILTFKKKEKQTVQQ